MAQQRYEALAGESFQAYMVVAQDGDAVDADAAYCDRVKDVYGLTMPVLLMPDDALLPTILGIESSHNGWNILFEEGAVLHFAAKSPPQDDVDALIEALLDQ